MRVGRPGNTPSAPLGAAPGDKRATQPADGSGADAEDAVRELQARLDRERAAAFEAGRQAAQNAARQELQTHYERLARSIEELAGCRLRYRQETEREVVQLSLEIARRILRRELTVDPEAILGLLRAGLESVSLREVLEVRIHPAHVDAVRNALQKMGAPAAISIVGDAHLEPGAVSIETRRGGFDASAETQLEEIQRGFADLMERSSAR
ncbi:MAG: FliH/SctL family protein [Bryobacteraceae bacterium]|nr:FliH/SctL family protein [Bryobacteraceae bacterium]